jgi:hypothetical protein
LYANNIAIVQNALAKPGNRIQMTYKATTAGHGDVKGQGGNDSFRIVEPVAWLNNCHLRIFMCKDGHKYRISGIQGEAKALPREDKEKSSEKDDD